MNLKEKVKEINQEFKMLTGKEIIDNLRGKEKKEERKEDKKKGIGGR
ncbi:MAG: hypothetical protein IKI04_03340 [Bacilli bacterium]|nr:hypothetical protein [Bacilli bacterium]